MPNEKKVIAEEIPGLTTCIGKSKSHSMKLKFEKNL